MIRFGIRFPEICFRKMSIKKHLNSLELLYKKKENIPCDFFIDEIDVDSYFFHNFLDVMLSKIEFFD